MENERRIQWDEETIKEHDKERGTRMKIDEPKTPFHYLDEAECDEEEKEHGALEHDAVSEKLAKIEKKQQFEARRKAHYNEFQMIQQLRAQMQDEDDEDDD